MTQLPPGFQLDQQPDGALPPGFVVDPTPPERDTLTRFTSGLQPMEPPKIEEGERDQFVQGQLRAIGEAAIQSSGPDIQQWAGRSDITQDDALKWLQETGGESAQQQLQEFEERARGQFEELKYGETFQQHVTERARELAREEGMSEGLVEARAAQIMDELGMGMEFGPEEFRRQGVTAMPREFGVGIMRGTGRILGEVGAAGVGVIETARQRLLDPMQRQRGAAVNPSLLRRVEAATVQGTHHWAERWRASDVADEGLGWLADPLWWSAMGGEQVPVFASLFLGAGAGGAVAARAGMGARAAATTQMLASTGSIGGLYAASTYHEGKQLLMEQGFNEQEASERAATGSAISGTMAAIFARLPYGAFIARQPQATSRMASALRGAIAEGSSESLQELSQLLALYGMDAKSPEAQDIMRIVQATAVATPMGAGFGAMQGGRGPQQQQSTDLMMREAETIVDGHVGIEGVSEQQQPHHPLQLEQRRFLPDDPTLGRDRAQERGWVQPVIEREIPEPPTAFLEDGRRTVFSATQRDPRANAQNYAEGLREADPTAYVEVKRLPRRAGWEVVYTPHGQTAVDFQRDLGGLSRTQRRRMVRVARELGIAENVGEIRNLHPEQMLKLISYNPTPPRVPEYPYQPTRPIEPVSDPTTVVERREMHRERNEVEQMQQQGELEAAQARIRQLEAELRTDPLSQVGNKRSHDEGMMTLQGLVADSDQGTGFLFFDLANLKALNDARGHEGANQEIYRVAQAIKDTVGDRGRVHRYGGDEFTVTPTRTMSRQEAQRLRDEVEMAVGIEPIAPGVSVFVSGGVGVIPPGATTNTMSEAVTEADRQSENRKKKLKQERGEFTDRASAEQAVHGQKVNAKQRKAAEETPVIDEEGSQPAQKSAGRDPRGVRSEMRRNETHPESENEVRRVAEEYARQKGLEPPREQSVSFIDPGRGREIAEAYEAVEHAPTDPEVQASYNAFKRETLEQYQFLVDQGFTFELTQEPAPYQNVPEMQQDLAQNRRLRVFQDPGDMPRDHPMTEIAPDTGGQTYNQVFRAVHDIFGHAKSGYAFDILGEDNAWRSHRLMYTDAAQGALATETLGQSSWVGYGPFGTQNQLAVQQDRIGDVQFPNQKAGLMPRQVWDQPVRRVDIVGPEAAQNQIMEAMMEVPRAQVRTLLEAAQETEVLQSNNARAERARLMELLDSQREAGLRESRESRVSPAHNQTRNQADNRRVC